MGELDFENVFRMSEEEYKEKFKDLKVCYYFVKDIYNISKLKETYCHKALNCCDNQGCCKPTSPWWYLLIFPVVGFILWVMWFFWRDFATTLCNNQDEPLSTQQNVTDEHNYSPEIHLSLLSDRHESNSAFRPSAPPADIPITPPPSYEDVATAHEDVTNGHGEQEKLKKTKS